ncbi:protein jagunal [Tetranychus urticae]|uniref:Protein jagunal n=1 Tax=Tetranychus urticae TaxID=32264 RepID=T1L1P7_TETUR|nr:protein jagunal [Tetranychus urticae]
MASKGPMVQGTDGSDHLHRQTIALHYSQSVINKSRLKWSITMHYLLFGLMVAKLTDDILDRFDVFILELQQLYIPKPMIWEWIWTLSVFFNYIASKAMKKNNPTSMKFYLFIINLTAIFPVFYAMIVYLSDFLVYFETRDVTKVTHVWNKYPLAVIWYGFLLVALQVHLAQFVFAYKLIKVWSLKKRRE